MKKTLYQILEVEPTATAGEIAAACQRLAAVPADKWPDPNTPAFLRQAREILLDPRQRLTYDNSLSGQPAHAIVESRERVSSGSALGWGAGLIVTAAIGTGAWWAMHRPPPPVSVPSLPTATAVPAVKREPAPPASAPAPAPVSASTPAPVRSVEAISVPAEQPRTAENVFADVGPSVARVDIVDAAGHPLGNGSAVVIDKAVMLTSCHVAKAGAKISVKLGAVVLPATIELADEALDLCRLSVPGLRASAVKIGSVDTLRTGQKVFAIGAPAGFELTISEGIVSALRKVDEGTVIQTTAPISPGSSGGGLFDLNGRLVGIMTFQHSFGQNLNFALPADWIAQMRARTATAGGWRAAAVANAPQGGSPASLILGQWFCRDWISGRTAQYNFELDGRLSMTLSNGQAAAVKYRVSGNSLEISDGAKGAALALGELTARKLVFRGQDRSVACERQ